MKLVFKTGEISLLAHENIEYHDGRDNSSLVLDISIINIQTSARAEELVDLLISLYPYPKYRMDLPIAKPLIESLYEVRFLAGNFAPFKII
jgi:hypothetical protein